VNPAAICHHLFPWATPAHADDDGATEDRIGEPSETGQRHGAVGRDLLGHHLLAVHDASTGNGTAPMTGIKQPPDFLVLLGLGAVIGPH